MVSLVATPESSIETRWRNLIRVAHNQTFGSPHDDMTSHWWFVETRQGEVTGLAGAKREDDTTLFIGPCIVFREWRGQGIQRLLIKAREELAKQNGFNRVVTYTHFTNHYSSNNLILSGYTIIPPWHPCLEACGVFIYWEKCL